MVPANSIPSMWIFGRSRPIMNLTTNGSAFLIRQSAAQTVVAWMRTRTSLSLGMGFSTSLIWRTSGGPYSVKTAALIAHLLFAQECQGIHRQRALRGNPGGREPQQQHRQDNASQYERIAGSCLIHDGRQHSRGQESEEQSGRRTYGEQSQCSAQRRL